MTPGETLGTLYTICVGTDKAKPYTCRLLPSSFLTREGYACGTMCSGGKSRAFHLCVVDSSAVIPPGPREGPDEPDRKFNLNSQRMSFNAYPAEQY